MVIYDLICDLEHQFEGWFKSERDFIQQQKDGLLCCPTCESKSVRKLPSASYVSTSRQAESKVSEKNDVTLNAHQAVKMINDYVLSNTEDVGERFVEEVKKMHYGEIDGRNIRGRASSDEVQSLNDEGINVLSLPDNTLDKKKLN